MKIRITLTQDEATLVSEGLQTKVDKDMADVMVNKFVDPKLTAMAYSLRNRIDAQHAKVLELAS